MNIYWLEQREVDVPTDDRWLNTNELDRLGNMSVPKRRADWRLGRWTAKQAVISFLDRSADSSNLAKIEIHARPSGAPEVFLHDQLALVSISLSHSSGTALCTIAGFGRDFGCDLEKIEPRADAFIADYFTPQEKVIIARSEIENRSLLVTLFWSAKESALKTLRSGLRLSTTSVSVQLSEDDPCLRKKVHQAMHADATEWRPLSVRISADRVFTGYWRVKGNLVRTVVSDVPQFTLHQFIETSLATSLEPPSLSRL